MSFDKRDVKRVQRKINYLLKVNGTKATQEVCLYLEDPHIGRSRVILKVRDFDCEEVMAYMKVIGSPTDNATYGIQKGSIFPDAKSALEHFWFKVRSKVVREVLES